MNNKRKKKKERKKEATGQLNSTEKQKDHTQKSRKQSMVFQPGLWGRGETEAATTR
jgi:hypothetical protein